VFERDGYKCQLCMRKCLHKFTIVNDVPHPLSPTIDHIVAISLGINGHTWDNVQCACWECNVAKGARAVGQLRLTLA
jgi:5-methylcytosine-specific restriction endonuclease McrA